MDLAAQAWAEVVARHAFFVDWFTGNAGPEAMEHSARAFAPDFQMIGPDGEVTDCPAVLAMLEGARGKRGADFTIRVELQGARVIGDGLALVIYDEHQQIGGETTARRSSAVFSAAKDAPESVLWRHLQETWIA